MFGTLLIIIITYMKADILKPSRQTILREAKDYVMIAVGMILYGPFSYSPTTLRRAECRVLHLLYIGQRDSRYSIHISALTFSYCCLRLSYWD